MGKCSLVALLALAGCGRVAFDVLFDASASTSPDPNVDAPPGTMLVTFGETPGATYKGVTRDTYLNGISIGHNFGGERYVSVGVSPHMVGLMRFDVRALAPGTVVAGATLHLSSTTALAADLEIYEVLEPWQEGTKTGGTETADWVQRLPATNWTTRGAQPPGSRASIAIARAAPQPAGATAVVFDSQGVAVIQRWVDDPATNLGFALEQTTGGALFRFASRQELTAASRPLLELAIR